MNNNHTNEIFKLIKKKKFNKIYNYIKLNNIIYLDIKDNNSNYFIQYLIIYNQYKLLFNIINNNLIILRFDMLDIDGRTLLYNCIKFNYIKIIKLLLDHNKNNIGISIIDIKDKLGLTALHYSVIFNNYDSFKLLLENNANPYITSNDDNNVFHILLIYERNEMLNYLLDNNYSLNFKNLIGDTLLQSAVNYNNITIIIKILNKTINLNNVNNNYGLSIIHQSIIFNNMHLFKLLLEKKIDINLTDFYGNTPLHYILYEKNFDYFSLIINKNIIYDLTNINGDTPLHILLDYDNIDDTIIEKFIINTDLNLQNNNKITCFMKLITKNLLYKYKKILVNKPLNIYIQNINSNNKIIFDDELLDILIESYYNQIIINDNLSDWELWCNKYIKKSKFDINNFENKNDINIYNNIIKITKLDKKSSLNINTICKEKIKYIIVNENRSMPLYNNKLDIDNGIIINMCSYTGSTIDILFGLLLLLKEFNNIGLNIIIDYPLSINNKLEEHYIKLGINYPYKLDFSNIEIIWSFQKIFFPTYFDNEIENKQINSKYIVIPIGIETSLGSHANILFWDIANKTLERFDPNGSKYPIGFNYNPELLDSLLYNKFIQFDKNIKYYNPSKFLPTVSFQILENLETNIYKKIGDPSGFCGVWCIWWVYQRLKNINITIDNIAGELIKYIKYDNISFKNIIRNFSSKITTNRDIFLKKYNIDINDWIAGNYTQEILNNLEKDIFLSINL